MNTQVSSDKLLFLRNKALAIRIDSLRSTTASKSGHPTSCLSAADIIAALFFHCMRYNPFEHKHEENDRFILSKGHAIPVVYAAYKHLGLLTDEELLKLRTFDSPLEGHPTPRFKYNEAATGSLGQGLSVGAGMALYAKKMKLQYTTYVLLGDGECAEGAIWEAAEFSSHYTLDNLIGIIDANRLAQSDESIDNHHLGVMQKKWEAFGWKALVIDGHNTKEIVAALTQAKTSNNQPVMIIAKTWKGYGLDDIQDTNGYHGKPFSQDEVEKRIQQLKGKFKEENNYQPPSYTPPTLPPVKEQSETFPITLDIANDANATLFEVGKELATRKAFGYALAALGRKNNTTFVFDGDVKNSTFTQIFEDEFPEHFVQCFIAEQNMLGVATGMQLRGALPFVATFGAFFTRAFDQIRMAGVGRNALRLSGSHCGVSIGKDGPSQMALEDIAMMRTLPNSVVLYPSDAVATYKLVECMANYNEGISYLRTTRATTPIIYKKEDTFTIGGCAVLQQSDNDKACIVAVGITVHEALKAQSILKQDGICVSIVDLYSVKPIDRKTLLSVAQQSNNLIITVEDHYLAGGMGQAVACELINDAVHIASLAVTKLPQSATPEKLMAYEEIDAAAIVKKIKQLV